MINNPEGHEPPYRNEVEMDHEARLVRIETKMETFVTKEDLANFKASILKTLQDMSDKQTDRLDSMTHWVIGTLITVALTMVGTVGAFIYYLLSAA